MNTNPSAPEKGSDKLTALLGRPGAVRSDAPCIHEGSPLQRVKPDVR